jgi:hypothetical protein
MTTEELQARIAELEERVAELEAMGRDIWNQMQHWPAPVGRYEVPIGKVQRTVSAHVQVRQP